MQVRKFEVPYGATNPDKGVGENGIGVMVLGAKGLSEGAKMMKGMGMALDIEERGLEDWPERLESEMREKGSHFRILGVWGQKKANE